jgi:hypothetical protein
MRTFAHQQRPSPHIVSSTVARPDRAGLYSAQYTPPVFGMQRSVANQVGQHGRPPVAASPAAVVGLGAASPGYDLSRVPVHVPETGKEVNVASPSVHDVLAASGQPLEPGPRRFMERQFGHNFSQVRIHTDARAGASADALNAHAYTVGDHIVFGSRAYAPKTVQGRLLLAHELTHVVQQASVRPSLGVPLAIGGPTDRAEHDAEAAAPAIIPMGHLLQEGLAARYVAQHRVSHPLLQRKVKAGDATVKPVDTWAGQFVVDEYEAEQGETDKDVNGATITMRFHPNDFVDATKVAFVQSAQSLVDGKPHKKNNASQREQEVVASRTIPESFPGEGTQIDQVPYSQTPLAGMKNNPAYPEPNPKYTEIGFHFTDKSGKLNEHDAMLHDEPFLTISADKQKSQTLESAALAIEGNQKGVFYGSVQWGWYMNPGDKYAHLLEFKGKSKDAPSAIFGEAARLWNASRTTLDQPTIDVPSTDVYRISAATELWQGMGTGKIGILSKNTRVELTEKREPNSPAFWLNVVVVSGPLTGRMGWLAGTKLTPAETMAAPKK